MGYKFMCSSQNVDVSQAVSGKASCPDGMRVVSIDGLVHLDYGFKG